MKINPILILFLPLVRLNYWYQRNIRPILDKLRAPKESDALHEIGIWENSETVTTIYGTLKGQKHGSTWNWRGIPFARPPIKDLRWKAPGDPSPWLGVRKSTRFASASAQIVPFIGKMGSEDCLYLNIWRPMSDNTKLPVYVYIHGGGNTIGATATRDFHGHKLAQKAKVVYVTVAYRLGMMGWMSHPALDEGRTEEEKGGNYATLDLIKALQWIQDNIEAFGGDPGNVLLAGESAGAMNILSLLSSPLSKNLFHKAVLESGISMTLDMESAVAQSNKLISTLLLRDKKARSPAEAESLLATMSKEEIGDYLQGKSTFSLLAGARAEVMGMGGWLSLFRDGVVIPEKGYNIFKDETWEPVPLLIGVNRDEAKLFGFLMQDPPLDSELYEPVNNYRSLLWRVDGMDHLVSLMKQHPKNPSIYAYRFDWGAMDEGESVLPGNYGKQLGAAHYAEVPFFHGLETNEIFYFTGSHFTSQNKKGKDLLSDTIIQYLSNFAWKSDPNGDVPVWDEYGDTGRVQVLDAGPGELRISKLEGKLTYEDIKKQMREELDEKEYEAVMKYLEDQPPFGFKGTH